MTAFRGLGVLLLPTVLAASVFLPGLESWGQIAITKTVGLNPSECAQSNLLVIPAPRLVFYCYTAQNIGDTTHSVHFLIDDQVGIVLESDTILMAPGEVLSVTAPFFVEADVINHATWTVDDQFVDTASATVLVRNFPCADSPKDLVRNGGFETPSPQGSPLFWSLDPGAQANAQISRSGMVSVQVFSPTATLTQRIIPQESGLAQVSWYELDLSKGTLPPFVLASLPAFTVTQGAPFDVQIGPFPQTAQGGSVFIDDVSVLFCPAPVETPTPTLEPTETPTFTPTPTETFTLTPTFTFTETPTETFTPSLTPTHTPTSTPTFTNTPVATRTQPPPGDVIIVSPPDQGVFGEGDPIDFEWIRDEAGLIHLMVISRVVGPGNHLAIGGGVFSGSDPDQFVQPLPAGAYIFSATALNLTLNVVFSVDEVRFFVGGSDTKAPLLDFDLNGKINAKDLILMLSDLVQKTSYSQEVDLFHLSTVWQGSGPKALSPRLEPLD